MVSTRATPGISASSASDTLIAAVLSSVHGLRGRVEGGLRGRVEGGLRGRVEGGLLGRLKEREVRGELLGPYLDGQEAGRPALAGLGQEPAQLVQRADGRGPERGEQVRGAGARGARPEPA